MAAGLGVDILGVWPLGFTSFPEGRIIGLTRAAGNEPIRLSRALADGPGLAVTIPTLPIGLGRAFSSGPGLTAVVPAEPIGISRTQPSALSLNRGGTP